MDLSKIPGKSKVIEYKNDVPDKPVVSVCVTAYNHEKFIKQCLDSILEQQTGFDFEILLGEDDSTDKTRRICKQYADKYPDKIRLFLHNRKNVISIGGKPTGRYNFLYNFAQARGKYIALCDGDDYWTDVTKLQRQVDFMESHPDYAFSFHPVTVIYQDASEADSVYPKDKPTLTTSELLTRNFIQTNSVMYRKQGYKDIPVDFMPGDWYMHLYHAKFGKIGCIDRKMSAYRHHKGGIWSGSGSDPNGFWSRYGYSHLMLFIRVLDMYGQDEHKKSIIYNNISETAVLICEHADNSQVIIEKFIDTYPNLASVVLRALTSGLALLRRDIKNRDKSIQELQKAYEAKQAELNDITSSKVWKMRNKAVRALGKKKV